MLKLLILGKLANSSFDEPFYRMSFKLKIEEQKLRPLTKTCQMSLLTFSVEANHFFGKNKHQKAQ